MKENAPILSVVVPTYRREEPLRRTLDSIRAQGLNDYELIVVDQTPGHEAETATYLRVLELDPHVTALRESVPNLPRARNAGVAKARGKYVLFLDDDVLLPPGFLARYLGAFETTGADAIGGMTLDPGEQLEDVPPLPVSAHEARDRVDFPICAHATRVPGALHLAGANMGFRRSWIERVGGFNDCLTGSALGEDLEFTGRLRRAGGTTVYEPSLALVHDRAPAGGCRNTGDSFARSRERMANYYFALFHGVGRPLAVRILARRWFKLFQRAAGKRTAVRGTAPGGAVPRNRFASAAGRVAGACEGIARAFQQRRIVGHLYRHASANSISVVVPTYNREEHLVHTLESLQQFRDEVLEIIVVDQTQKHLPATEEYLRQQSRAGHIKWLRLRTPGASRVRNTAAVVARGDVLLFVDDDITALPRLVEEHRRHYSSPEVLAVGGRIAWRVEDVAGEFPFPGDALRAYFDIDAPVCYCTTPFRDAFHVITCNFSVRRQAMIAAGGFHEWFRGGGEDIEFVARLRRLGGRIVYEPNAVVIHHSAPAGGTRIKASSALVYGYRRGLLRHFSTLRAVGLSGWIRSSFRRLVSMSRRFRAANHPGTIPVQNTARTTLNVKSFQLLGSLAAVPHAALLFFLNIGVGGHYMNAVRRFARRRR